MGQLYAIAAIGAMLYFMGLGIVGGVKWVGHQGMKVEHRIVHIIKKVL